MHVYMRVYVKYAYKDRADDKNREGPGKFNKDLKQLNRKASSKNTYTMIANMLKASGIHWLYNTN